MKEIFKRECWECSHKVPNDYDANSCPKCGEKTIPTVSCPVMQRFPDGSALEWFWNGKTDSVIKYSACAVYPIRKGEDLEF
jgi:hypothetical protein